MFLDVLLVAILRSIIAMEKTEASLGQCQLNNLAGYVDFLSGVDLEVLPLCDLLIMRALTHV